MAMCTLMIEKARNIRDRAVAGNPGSLVRDRAAANPRSYSEPTIQQERIRGKENDLIKKWFQDVPGNFDLSSQLKRSSLQDLSTLPSRDQVRTLLGKKR